MKLLIFRSCCALDKLGTKGESRGPAVSEVERSKHAATFQASDQTETCVQILSMSYFSVSSKAEEGLMQR